VAEPPLETWVTDSIDKPTRTMRATTRSTQAEQMQSMQQSQETHALKMAKAAHEVALAGAKAHAPPQRADDGTPTLGPRSASAEDAARGGDAPGAARVSRRIEAEGSGEEWRVGRRTRVGQGSGVRRPGGE
jgi:hypothetical protein